MKKPEDNETNSSRCICEQCGLHIGMVCDAENAEGKKAKFYCARKPSKCKMGDGTCYCPGCEVYQENGLAGYTFCKEEIEE